MPAPQEHLPPRPDAPRAGDGTSPPSERRRTLVFAASAVLAVALLAGSAAAIRVGASTAPRPPAASPPLVRTLTLVARDGHDVRRVHAARVEAAREISLSFESGGTLATVDVDEGDRVAAGTVLARLDTRLLEARREQLRAARDALESDAELARLTLERQRALKAREFAPGEALDEARLATTRLAARLAEAEAALALVAVELDKAVLRAPFDALIGARHLDPGATVTPGTPLLALLDAGVPRLRVGLPPARAATLDGERDYTFEAGGRTLRARLLSRRGDVDARTRTVSTLFEPIGEARRDLLPGELAELVLVERVDGPVFEVPLAALAEAERGLWSVFSPIDERSGAPAAATLAGGASDDAAGERHAELRRVAVEIVHLDGEHAYVRAALDAGTPIVADGGHRVVDGERVRLRADPDRGSLTTRTDGGGTVVGDDPGRRAAEGSGRGGGADGGRGAGAPQRERGA